MGEDVDFCVVPVNPLAVVPNLFGLLDAHRQSPLEEPDSRASIGRVAHEEGCVNRAFRLVPGRARPIWIATLARPQRGGPGWTEICRRASNAERASRSNCPCLLSQAPSR